MTSDHAYVFTVEVVYSAWTGFQTQPRYEASGGF